MKKTMWKAWVRGYKHVPGHTVSTKLYVEVAAANSHAAFTCMIYSFQTELKSAVKIWLGVFVTASFN